MADNKFLDLLSFILMRMTCMLPLIGVKLKQHHFRPCLSVALGRRATDEELTELFRIIEMDMRDGRWPVN